MCDRARCALPWTLHALSESTASSRSSDFRARRSQCPERSVLKPFSVENRRRTGVLHPRRRPHTNSSEPCRELARFTTARARGTAQTSSCAAVVTGGDRKSTRLNSSHGYISYAVFCLKKKKQTTRD